MDSNPIHTIDALRQSRLFGSLNDRQLATLAAHTDVVVVDAGRTISTRGRRAHQAVVLIDGLVQIARAGGATTVAGPGTVIGARSIAETAVNDADVVTRVPSTLLVVNGPAFAWALLEAPGLRPLLVAA